MSRDTNTQKMCKIILIYLSVSIQTGIQKYILAGNEILFGTESALHVTLMKPHRLEFHNYIDALI